MTQELATYAKDNNRATINGMWFNSRINLDAETTQWNEHPVSGDAIAIARRNLLAGESELTEENKPREIFITNNQETETMETLAQHVDTYINDNDNNVSYTMPYALIEYLTDYASINDGATYDEVETALNTLDHHWFGEYSNYREAVEAMLEAQGADPIPSWITIDYKQTWESDMRHMINIIGDTYNTGDGYYFNEH